MCGDGILQQSVQRREACDDGNSDVGDGCNLSCQYEMCGDGRIDSDGPDNNLATLEDNEICDAGRVCPDGTDCTHDATLCPGACEIAPDGICADTCQLGICGDTIVQSGSVVVGSGTLSLVEACDVGMYCADAMTPCTDAPHFCGLLGIGDGSCTPRSVQ